MRPLLAVLLLVAGTGRNLRADDKKADNSERAQVTKFLKEHVIDKTIVSPRKTYKLDEGRIEADYEDVTTFNNFAESGGGFSFDMTIAKKYTRYDVGKDGKRVQPGADRSLTEVYRYEVAERLSTKKLTGTCRSTSTTSAASSPTRLGTVTLVTGIKIAEGKLGWTETVPGYVDIAAPGGQYKTGQHRRQANLFRRQRPASIRVRGYGVRGRSETLKRTPKKEKPMEFVAEEPAK